MQDLDGSRADTVLDGAERSWRARLAGWLADAPSYPPNAGDLRTVTILGLALPVRATVAVLAVSMILLLDYHGASTGWSKRCLGPFGDAPSRRRSGSRGWRGSCCWAPLPLLIVAARCSGTGRPRYGLQARGLAGRGGDRHRRLRA